MRHNVHSLFNKLPVLAQSALRMRTRYQNIGKRAYSHSKNNDSSNLNYKDTFYIAAAITTGTASAYWLFNQFQQPQEIDDSHFKKNGSSRRKTRNTAKPHEQFDPMKKHIVIVGGGVAGHRLAYKLQNDLNVTLIEPKSFFEVPMAVPRMMLKPELAERAIIPYTDFLPHVNHIQGWALNLGENEIKVQKHQGGKTEEINISFDYAVIATGSSYESDLLKPYLGDVADRKYRVNETVEELLNAKNVLIVGGGPVGVEIAGEILENTHDKQITVVHSGNKLLHGTTEKSSNNAESFLKNNRVSLYKNERVIETEALDDGSFIAITDQGKKIPYDMIINCFGASPNTSLFKDSLPDALNQKQQVKVDQNLQVSNHPNIFAIGDITNLDENKMARHALKHVKVVAKNIRTLSNGKGSKELLTYKPATGNPMMVVTFGSKQGTAALPFGTTTWQFVINKIKGDMFVDRYRREINVVSNAN